MAPSPLDRRDPYQRSHLGRPNFEKTDRYLRYVLRQCTLSLISIIPHMLKEFASCLGLTNDWKYTKRQFYGSSMEVWDLVRVFYMKNECSIYVVQVPKSLTLMTVFIEHVSSNNALEDLHL